MNSFFRFRLQRSVPSFVQIGSKLRPREQGNAQTHRDDTGDFIICPMLRYSNGTDNNQWHNNKSPGLACWCSCLFVSDEDSSAKTTSTVTEQPIQVKHLTVMTDYWKNGQWCSFIFSTSHTLLQEWNWHRRGDKFSLVQSLQVYTHSVCVKTSSTRIHSVECGIYPIAVQTVTFILPSISVSVTGVYYTDKVFQYVQNTEVKGLPYKDFEILMIKCTEVTTSTSEHHRWHDNSTPTRPIWFPVGAPFTVTRYLELFSR